MEDGVGWIQHCIYNYVYKFLFGKWLKKTTVNTIMTIIKFIEQFFRPKLMFVPYMLNAL